jgi:ssDNA-binding Zn-finger/Zn-ribbon topoisomerase 1
MEVDCTLNCPECDFEWELAKEADDNGWIEDLEVCPECAHEFTYKRDLDDIWDKADEAYDRLMED